MVLESLLTCLAVKNFLNFISNKAIIMRETAAITPQIIIAELEVDELASVDSEMVNMLEGLQALFKKVYPAEQLVQ